MTRAEEVLVEIDKSFVWHQEAELPDECSLETFLELTRKTFMLTQDAVDDLRSHLLKYEKSRLNMLRTEQDQKQYEDDLAAWRRSETLAEIED